MQRLQVIFFVVLSATGVEACTGNSSTTANGTSGTAALDGTWDITSYASATLAPSSVTVIGGKLEGSLTYADNKPGCSRTLAFAIEGDTMTGSSVPAGTCSTTGRPRTLTGSRTLAKSSSDTPWDGSWVVREGGESTPEALTISGLSASSPNFSLSVAGGVATATGSSRFTFIARRR